MTATWKRLAIPGAMTAFAATALYSAGLATQHGTGGNAPTATSGAPQEVQDNTPGVALGGIAHNLFGVNPGTGNVYHISEAAGTSTVVGGTNTLLSGMSKLPGTRDYYASGGMTDGGNIYIAQLGSSILLGNSGLGAIPGLAFDPADSTLYGTYTVSVLADGLCEIDTLSGAATPIGGGFGGAIGGIDAIAIDPTDGTMYGSTGFFYDGSPGDVITINKATGVATDTGVDMSPQPPSTVAGMAFADDGSGYVSIGAGNGAVYSWDTSSHSLTIINASATGGAGSMSDIEVAR